MSNCIISPNVPNTVWIVYDVVAPYQHCLETEADLARSADQVYLQAGVSHAMPPGNLTLMEEGERRKIVAWYQNIKDF